MSTVFDFRNLRLPKLSRAAVVIGALAIVAALVLAYLGIQLYKKLTTNTVVAYFPDTLALPFDPLGRALFRRVRRS